MGAARNTFTGRGLFGVSPFINKSNIYTLLEQHLGYNSLSKIEVVSLININNISTHYLHHNIDNCTLKYNPKVYIGAQNSYSYRWIYDSENTPKYPQKNWPESYQQSAQLTTPNTTAKYGTEQFYESSSNPGYRVRKSMSTNMVTYYDTATNSWQFLIDNLYEYDYNI